MYVFLLVLVINEFSNFFANDLFFFFCILLQLTKPFTTPVICLGKDANKPVSQTVECLADVYKFEEMYQECRIIRI